MPLAGPVTYKIRCVCQLCGAYFDTILVGLISTLAHECIELCKQSQIYVMQPKFQS